MELHELDRTFEQFSPTPEQERAMLDRLLNGERKDTPVKKRKKVTVVFAAAALLLACAFTVAAGLDQRLLNYLEVEPEKAYLLSDAAVQVEESHTYANGWTLDVVQTFADRYSALILVDVTAPEGTDLSGERQALDGNVWVVDWDGQRGGWEYGFRVLEEENAAGNCQSYLLSVYPCAGSDSLLGAEVEFTPEQFRYLKDGAWEEVDLTEEEWTFLLTFSDEDVGLSFDVERPILVDGFGLTLEGLYLSPISFSLELDEGTASLEDTQLNLNSFMRDWNENVILHTSSGEEIKVNGFYQASLSYKSDRSDREYGRICYALEQVIQPEEIVSVTLCGQTFFLNDPGAAGN